MSSLRNSIPSRSYRERAQPLSRSNKHPLLEKKRDYKLRAADHKRKQTQLKALRERAANRNPDEFAFGMMAAGARAGGPKRRNAANSGGVAEDEEEGGRAPAGTGMTQEVVRLLKTQDAGYLRRARAVVRRKREELERALLFGGEGVRVLGEGKVLREEEEEDAEDDLGIEETGGERRASHTVFVDGEKEQRHFDAATHFETTEQGVRAAHNRPRSAHGAAAETKAVFSGKQKRQREKQAALLATLRAQEKDLGTAERELELQRARMAGNIGGVDKSGVRWKAKGRKR